MPLSVVNRKTRNQFFYGICIEFDAIKFIGYFSIEAHDVKNHFLRFPCIPPFH
jgi:hypothetical protein